MRRTAQGGGMEVWHPIEAAPKDGSAILLWLPTSQKAVPCTWNQTYACWTWVSVGSEEYAMFYETEGYVWTSLPAQAQGQHRDSIGKSQ
jgi:hypothetical protein